MPTMPTFLSIVHKICDRALAEFTWLNRVTVTFLMEVNVIQTIIVDLLIRFC